MSKLGTTFRGVASVVCLLPLGIFAPSGLGLAADIVTPVEPSVSYESAGLGDGLGVASLLPSPTAGDVGSQSSQADPEQRYRWTFPRSTADRPDVRSGPQVHVVFLLPAGAEDDQLDTLGVLEDSMLAQNVWMRQQSGDRQWRLDTYTFTWPDPEQIDPVTGEPVEVEIEAVDVTFVRSNQTQGSLSDIRSIADELHARGFDADNKRYLTYVASGGGGACGEALVNTTVPPPDQPTDAKYSAVYLDSPAGCRARDFAPDAQSPWWSETIAQQEMIHNDGMVPYSAPHDCKVSPLAIYHVCTGPLWASDALGLGVLDPEQVDVMYPFVGLPLDEKVLDRDNDDYFRHPWPYQDLHDSRYLEPVS